VLEDLPVEPEGGQAGLWVARWIRRDGPGPDRRHGGEDAREREEEREGTRRDALAPALAVAAAAEPLERPVLLDEALALAFQERT
jgi:hypothetical protein